MPVPGKVIEKNKKLLLTPTLVNDDPYDKGWMMKIEIMNPAEIENLLSEEQYKININQ